MEKRKKLYVSIPQYDGTINSFLAIQLVRQKELTYTDPKFTDIDITVEILNFESLVTRARNTQFTNFLNSGQDVWLMIDSDIVLSQEDILSIYDKVMKYNVVQYPYRIKDSKEVRIVVTGFRKLGYPFSIVEQQGTGIFQISREVQLKVKKYQEQNDYVYKMTLNDDTLYYDVFQQRLGVIESQNFRTYLSEDWFFCKILEQIGYSVYIDLSVTTHHITKNFWFTYSPEMIEIEVDGKKIPITKLQEQETENQEHEKLQETEVRQ